MAAEFTEVFPYRYVFGQALTMKGSDGGDLTLTLHLRSADPGTPEIQIRSGHMTVNRVA